MPPQGKLPLRIKVDVRDNFDAPECSVQKAFRTLEGIVGLKINCNVEWDLLHNALEGNPLDTTVLVASVAGVIEAWCNVLSTRLEDDRFEAWTEEVTDKLESIGSIKLRAEVSGDNRPTTSWSDSHRSFLISFPRTTTFSPAMAPSGFETDFEKLLKPEAAIKSATETVTANSASNDDGWAEIDETGEAASISIRPTQSSMVARPDRMPTIATLPGPDVLLRTLAPYILHVTRQGGGRLTIQSTHEPSLQFLSQYLQRWIKKDHQDVRKVPLLRVTLHESHFGLGLSHDAITIEPYDTNQERRGIEMNPTMLLSIIENVLGYRCLPQVSSGCWEFRREVAFA